MAAESSPCCAPQSTFIGACFGAAGGCAAGGGGAGRGRALRPDVCGRLDDVELLLPALRLLGGLRRFAFASPADAAEGCGASDKTRSMKLCAMLPVPPHSWARQARWAPPPVAPGAHGKPRPL